MIPLRVAVQLVTRRGFRVDRLDLIFATGIAIATILTLSILATFQVAERQDERSQRLSPVLDYDAAATSTGLAMVDPAVVSDRRWNGTAVERDYFASSTKTLLPPGVSSLPKSGQFLASPALVRAIETDPVVADLFQGHELAGSIRAEGLTNPGQRRAIIGVPPDAPLLIAVEGFGSDVEVRSAAIDDHATLNTVVASLGLTLVALPALAMLFVVSRLSGRSRQIRSRSLRLIGLSNAGIRVVEAVAFLPLLIAAVTVGAAAFALLRPLESIPGTTVAFYEGDTGLSPLAVLAALVCLVALGCLLAATTVSVTDDAADTARRTRAWKHAGSVGIGLLGSGVAALFLMPILRSALGPVANFLIWPACGAVAAGLAISGPALVERVARSHAKRTRSTSALIGLRLTAGGSSTMLRISSVVCILVVVLLGTQSFLNILNGGTTEDWASRADRTPSVPVTVTDLGGSGSLQVVKKAVPNRPAIQVRELRTSSDENIRVVFGTCDDLRGLSGRATRGCDGKPAWIRLSGEAATRERPTGSLLAGPDRITVPAEREIRATNLPQDVDGALLVPRTPVSTSTTSGGSIFYALLDGHGLNASLARVSSSIPTAQFDLGPLDRQNPDTQQFPRQIEWIKIAASLGFAFGALAIAAGALGDARDRRSRFRGLRLLGAPQRQLVTVHGYYTLTPLLVLGLTACGLGSLVSCAFHALDERAAFPSATLNLLLAGVFVAALLVCAVSAPRRRDFIPPSERRTRR